MGTFGIFQIKKSIFLKVADIVREIDIWPENDILGVLEWFGTLFRYLESPTVFSKSWVSTLKMDIFVKT